MQVWDQLIGAVCRPFRIEYKTNDLLGGARLGINGSRLVGRTVVRRQDFVITNKRDQRLQCSYWQVDGAGNATGRLPGVIYCHCNSGSRLDAVEAIWTLVPLGVRVFALDFSGSGVSEGDYVTLGAGEVHDLECLVQFIRDGGHTSTLALWGRSMGAVTALLYSERDPSVAGIVLDSPFSRLTDLMRELVEEQRIPLWGLVGGTALKLMRRSVKKRAGFDINDINPVEYAPRAFIPALFGHARGDTFVKAHHTERLHGAYAGEKELMLFDDCDHNSPRPAAFYETVRSFLARALHLPREQSPRARAMLEAANEMMPESDAGHTHSMSPFQVASTIFLDDGDGDAADVDLQTALQASMQELSLADADDMSDDGSPVGGGAVGVDGRRGNAHAALVGDESGTGRADKGPKGEAGSGAARTARSSSGAPESRGGQGRPGSSEAAAAAAASRPPSDRPGNDVIL